MPQGVRVRALRKGRARRRAERIRRGRGDEKRGREDEQLRHGGEARRRFEARGTVFDEPVAGRDQPCRGSLLDSAPMPRIHKLPSAVIDRIAAGEVVERPASAVKELVENALDAGASRIDIEIDGGGVDRILVRDDGSGMTAEDARLALERHATSKISTDDDLARVATYGFRGEALPSIAAVSKLTLTTSDGSSPDAAAVRLRSDYGGKPSKETAARPRGTDVLLESLFETTPARRKFLASPEAEARAVAVVVTKAALSNPSVAFTLRSNGRETMDAPAAVDRGSRILQVFGR